MSAQPSIQTARSAAVGTINFFESHISAWEEHVERDVAEPAIYRRFRSVIARLRDHRGFRLRQDETVHKLIRRGYYNGRKGDLEVEARQSGRMFEFTFFQNVNVEHPHGGKYDFRKFERMPRTMQLACAVEMSHVLRKLLELGYVLEGNRHGIASADLLTVLRHAQGRTDEGDPLATFNRGWEWHRFERDESGWPTMKAVCSTWNIKDRDGVPLVSGETVCCRERGRLFRGVARPTPNGNWVVLSHGRAVNVHACEVFRCADPSAEPRRFVPKQAERVRRELEKALKANDYRRVETLARVAARCTPHPLPQEER